MVMWTTGQDAKSNPYKSIKYYQPLDTDTGYMADWGTQIMSLGVDYYQIIGSGTNQNPGVAIGWDKYGRVTTGIKASYAWTPSPRWVPVSRRTGRGTRWTPTPS
jgi:hypothetical protein